MIGPSMIGPSELVLVLAVPAVLFAMPRLRREALVVLVCLAIAALTTPPDPTTMLMVAAPLIFSVGLLFALARHLRRPKHA